MFRINEVLEFNGVLYRILAIFPDEIFWIPLYDDKAFPVSVGQNELLNAIEEGQLIRKADPYEYLSLENPEEGLSFIHKSLD